MAELVEGEEFPEPESLSLPSFQLDAGLSPLQAVVEWAAEGNPPGQRVAYILSIPAAAAESSLEESRNMLIPLLSQLAFDDHPDVKQATAEVLGPLGPILASKDPEAEGLGGSSDAMDLLVLAHRLLQDPERGVQEAASTSVAQFAGLLSHEHRREHLSAVIDALMHNFDDEQMQECAVDLLTKVAAVAGPQHPGWCEECALPRMLKLANHRDYNIRVHAVSGLIELAGCLPEEERTGSLLSAFADLCTDQVWSVRQDCASELAALAARLPRGAVRERLLPLWQGLAGDVSAWVQAAARRQAGPLLASIHPDDCSPVLLEAFVTAASGPATLTEACAHYLPAVLHNLGMERWPQLRDVVVALASSEYISVRVALAESMHQLAQQLGPAVVAADLLPVIQRLSGDDHQAVADALAVNIASLLASLPPGERLGQLGFLARMHPEDGSSCGQWRMRLLIAEQLAAIASLLQQQGLVEVLLPATLRLCEDPVAAVREAAAQQLGAMVRGLLAPAARHGGSGGEDGIAGDEQQRQQRQQRRQQQQQQQQEEQPQEAQPLEAEQESLLSRSLQQLSLADKLVGEAGASPQCNGEHQQMGDATAAAAAAAAAAAPVGEPVAAEAEHQMVATGQQQQEAQQQQQGQQQEGQQQEGQQQEHDEQEHDEQEQEDEGHGGQEPSGGVPAAMVQQIVRHMVELQRSGCHRSRQTYLLFCAALLLPLQQPDGAVAGDTVAGAGTGASSAAAGDIDLGQEEQQQEAAAAGAAPVWPVLPAAVAGSGIVQGLLEGAVALAADPVPNVRLGVARLLAALRRQQPQLADGHARVAAALASLAADLDRDVQQVAGST